MLKSYVNVLLSEAIKMFPETDNVDTADYGSLYRLKSIRFFSALFATRYAVCAKNRVFLVIGSKGKGGVDLWSLRLDSQFSREYYEKSHADGNRHQLEFI